LVLELHKLLDEVKNVPHAERLAPRPTKAGKFDITGGKMFFEDSALHGRVVAVLRDNLPDVAFGGVKFFLLMKHVLLSMHRMHALWRKRDWLTQAELKELESASDRLGECWGKLQWGVTPWVHWACVHSAYFARRFGSLYIFRSIPTEYRNQPFKRHLKNSMRGWCLRRPRITRLGMRHVVHTDALSVGLQLYEARQGRGAAVVKRRKRHVDQ
jgi:hypothetical protein